MRSEEETRALNARIEKLTAILEGVNAEYSMLLEQVRVCGCVSVCGDFSSIPSILRPSTSPQGERLGCGGRGLGPQCGSVVAGGWTEHVAAWRGARLEEHAPLPLPISHDNLPGLPSTTYAPDAARRPTRRPPHHPTHHPTRRRHRQVKRAEDDLLAARRANTSLRADRAKLDETISTLKLENDMVSRQVRVWACVCEELWGEGR